MLDNSQNRSLAPANPDGHLGSGTRGAAAAVVEIVRSVRPARPGPEQELVERFVDAIVRNRSVNRGACRTTAFLEPKLQSGYPDIVLVRWHEPTTTEWASTRANLSASDVRVAHALLGLGPRTECGLQPVLGEVRKALERLLDAGIVEQKAGCWRTASLRKTYAVREITAFEAKIADWRTAVHQAALNRWFASASYVLLPQRAWGDVVFEVARSANVGIWLEGQKKPSLPAPVDRTRQPLSYASWLFNEWAWQRACHFEKVGR